MQEVWRCERKNVSLRLEMSLSNSKKQLGIKFMRFVQHALTVHRPAQYPARPEGATCA